MKNLSRVFRAIHTSARLKSIDIFIVAQLVIPLTILLIFLLLPLGSLLYKAFTGSEGFTLNNFKELFSDPRMVASHPKLDFVDIEESYIFRIVNGTRVPVKVITINIGVHGPDFGIIFNSLFVASCVAVIDLVLGVSAAFIMARYDFPGKSVFRVVILIPMLATPFVNAYVLGKVFGRGGLINYFIHNVLGIKNVVVCIGGLPLVILVQSLSFFPIVYLNAYASLINIDPSLEEQAENLGAHGFKLARTITIPLAKPGIVAGTLVVFILSLEDLGAPIGIQGAFGEGLHNKLISFFIFDEFKKTRGAVAPTTYALAVFLLLIAIAVFLAVKKYVSLKQYAMLMKGSRFNLRIKRPKRKGLIAIYTFLIPLALSASFPQIGVIVLAFSDWAEKTLPSKFTLEGFISLFRKGEVVTAIRNSLTYAISATILIIIVGSGIAYIVSRTAIPGKDLIDAIATMPLVTPGILVGAGYIVFFSTFFSHTVLDPFFHPGTLLIFTFTVRRLPFALRAIFAGLQQTHIHLEEAALCLGATRARVYTTIVIPLIIANLIGGALLAFVYCMNEVSTSLMLSPLQSSQGTITFLMSEFITGAAVGVITITAALGVILMLLQITAITLSNRILKQRIAFLGV